ncbi:hypothetical protein [Roseinatronobacter bogoriensis]|uniref:Uncharacterized protein n=1 Tax=Roseinatronobacter bogoriensis subsp. barguzinensis TaxID=441209 RepID=A0A2K8KEI6_9RHOB|nr:hypothetical protein [Rhodobaca]ATX64560.1 hypothetical protein BG454_00865 [Rhodobaca barguzinensis]MBB4209742.1 hypothetical protein [Rhodobaca bogoriensis DSM 18756]TDW33708.1 hypothetical protein LY39_03541 [Rhodobaca barguzinensis]TDY66178.1 hypothetical protein EV660_11331 [Rhodobaca bogoriensis DSM 18756]
MLLDQLTSSSVTIADHFTELSPGARDEFAYVVLVGLVGKVPESRMNGEFRVGQLSLRYEWREEAPVGGTVVAHTENLKLILTDGVRLPGTASMPMLAILDLWTFVQAHSDKIAYWPSSERHRWISSTAQGFGVSDEFVRNLAINYPQLRRLCS